MGENKIYLYDEIKQQQVKDSPPYLHLLNYYSFYLKDMSDLLRSVYTTKSSDTINK